MSRDRARRKEKDETGAAWTASKYVHGISPPRTRLERAREEERAATLAELCGDLDRADQRLQAAIRLFRALRERRAVGVCVLRRAWLAFRMGRPDRAAKLARSAAKLPRDRDARISLALIEARLCLDDDPAAALKLAEKVGLTQPLGAPPWLRVETCVILGRACAALRRADEAVRACRTALDILDGIAPGAIPESAPLPYSLAQTEFYGELEAILSAVEGA